MYLGIDIGTSSVKAVIVDDKDTVVDQASAPLNVSRPQAGWSEQNPADWWAATNAAVAALPAKKRKAVRAVGLSGQMHGATLLDASDKPLRPAILWNDGRSEKQCATLEKAEPRSREITGNIAMPGFTAPKLVWVRENEPAVFKDTRCVLLPKDYVRLLMTGEKASDCSDAAGTLWVDVAQRKWSPEMLAATGLNESHMPRLVEGSDATGKLRKEVAQAWGMDEVPVAGGGGDNAAGAAGIGVIKPGDAFLSLGTSGVLFLVTPKFLPNSAKAVHAFCHCLPGVWHQMSVMLSAASCVDWAVKLTGLEDAAELLTKVEKREASRVPRSSCRTCRASARRTMTPPRAACCSVSTMIRMPRPSARQCSKAWHSRSPTGSMRSSRRAPPSTRFRSSAAARAPCGGAASWPRRSSGRWYTAMLLK